MLCAWSCVEHSQTATTYILKEKKKKKGKKQGKKEKSAALRLDAGKYTGWLDRINYNPAPTTKRKALSKLKPLGNETDTYVHAEDGEWLW